MDSTMTVGLDLAKDVFQVHGVNAEQAVTVRRQLRRRDVITFFSRLPPCLVGMEACGGAHYWARELERLGHTVRLMVPRYVKGYAKRSKNDAADAAAICEAVTRRHVESVPVKSLEQQCHLMLHKTRAGLVEARTKERNRVRAHLAELGIVAPKGPEGFSRLLALLREENSAGIPRPAQIALRPVVAVLDALTQSIADLDAEIRATLKRDETSRRLEAIPGVGTIAATAFAAVAAEVRVYRSARHYAASLGLTPRISGTGGEVTLGPISKQGNGYLRRLLFLGAQARLGRAKRNPGAVDARLLRLLQEKPFKVAAIALANHMARTIWALLARGGTYIANHRPAVPAALGLGCR